MQDSDSIFYRTQRNRFILLLISDFSIICEVYTNYSYFSFRLYLTLSVAVMQVQLPSLQWRGLSQLQTHTWSPLSSMDTWLLYRYRFRNTFFRGTVFKNNFIKWPSNFKYLGKFEFFDKNLLYMYLCISVKICFFFIFRIFKYKNLKKKGWILYLSIFKNFAKNLVLECKKLLLLLCNNY